MNFLAHLFLSGSDEELLVGNFIGDYVKGKSHELLPEGIARGVRLHRQIDHFTDTHPSVREMVALLRPAAGRYAAVVNDILMDHLLASEWTRHHTLSLRDFSEKAFDILFRYFDQLPLGVQQFLPRMRASDRLLSYAQPDGLLQAIRLMSQYTSMPDCSTEVGRQLRNHRFEFETKFTNFWPQIQHETQRTRLSPE